MTLSDINTLQPKCKIDWFDRWVIENAGNRHPSSWVDEYLRKTIRISRGRNRARRGLSYTITAEYMIAMAEAQNYRCAVSGIEFKYRDWKHLRRHPFMPSVDRIDCGIGYDPGNVRLVCLIVNLARADFGDEALVEMACAIAVANPVKSPSVVPCAPDGG